MTQFVTTMAKKTKVICCSRVSLPLIHPTNLDAFAGLPLSNR